MWDLIVSVPDHCLSFYFPRGRKAGDQCSKCDRTSLAWRPAPAISEKRRSKISGGKYGVQKNPGGVDDR